MASKLIFCQLIYLLFALLMAINSVQAKQLSYSHIDLGDSVQLNYRWLDQHQTEQTLSFTVAKQTLFGHFRNFKRYNPSYSEAYVIKKLKAYCAENPFQGVTVNFKKENQQISIDIQGKKPAAVNAAYRKLKKLGEQYLSEYLIQQGYHRFTNYAGEQAIKPNHIEIAAKSVLDVKVLKPIILKKVSVQNIRKVTNFILNFVQSIPYSPLESRLTSSGAGFLPPLTLLYKNQGDCDSKVTLAAAMLRSLMPRIGIIIVYIEQHALFGIEVIPQGDELTLSHQGITYVLAEPTGPALYALGQVDEFSKQAILAGLYTVEKVK